MGLMEPEFMKQGYHYYDESGVKIKPDAPEWAKKEYKEFMKLINPIPDENGLITQY